MSRKRKYIQMELFPLSSLDFMSSSMVVPVADQSINDAGLTYPRKTKLNSDQEDSVADDMQLIIDLSWATQKASP